MRVFLKNECNLRWITALEAKISPGLLLCKILAEFAQVTRGVVSGRGGGGGGGGAGYADLTSARGQCVAFFGKKLNATDTEVTQTFSFYWLT